MVKEQLIVTDDYDGDSDSDDGEAPPSRDHCIRDQLAEGKGGKKSAASKREKKEDRGREGRKGKKCGPVGYHIFILCNA